MSPLSVRRYRAERLLREEFDVLRGRVLASVRARLLASGASLDGSDLEACYAQAWQGLYSALLDGQEIANPAGWLVLVTFRRAIEELRTRAHLHHSADRGPSGEGPPDAHGGAVDRAWEEGDIAGLLDDRARLRQLLEAFRVRLSPREREAATLCYLQGLSRVEAAARMGVSEARMRKLMEGRSPGRPGVASKVGALVETIRGGEWCREQGSLMRALAYGLLDPDGERYRLAHLHRRECPACRAYVRSLRGLAAALPPSLLPLVATGAGAGAVGGAGAGGGASAAGMGGAGVAGGAGAAGGGWMLGGPLGAKLAAGCLLALGIGAGCVELGSGGHAPARPPGGSVALEPQRGPSVAGAAILGVRGRPGAAGPAVAIVGPLAGSAAQAGAASRGPGREFSPEQPAASSRGSVPSSPAVQPSRIEGVAAAARTPSAAASTAEREFSAG